SVPATGGPFSDGPLTQDLPEGTAFESSDDFDLVATGASALAGEITWQPVVYRGEVAWTPQELLVPLASDSDRRHEFTIPSAGYQLYASPTDESPVGEAEVGDNVSATNFTGGWALLSDSSWLKAPAQGAVSQNEAEGSGGTWD